MEPAVDYRLGGAAGHGRVQQHAAGRIDAGVERFQDFQLDIAIGAKVQGLRIAQPGRAGDRQVGEWAGNTRAANSDDPAVQCRHHGPFVVQLENHARLLAVGEGDRVRFKLGDLNRAAQLIHPGHRTGDAHLTIH